MLRCQRRLLQSSKESSSAAGELKKKKKNMKDSLTKHLEWKSQCIYIHLVRRTNYSSNDHWCGWQLGTCWWQLSKNTTEERLFPFPPVLWAQQKHLIEIWGWSGDGRQLCFAAAGAQRHKPTGTQSPLSICVRRWPCQGYEKDGEEDERDEEGDGRTE